jgi:hypothetical protein
VTRLLAAALLLSGLALSTPAQAQAIDPQFRADIEKLLDVTGAGALGAQMATLVSNSFIESMKQAQPDVPERVVTIVKETLNAEFSNAFAPKSELMGAMIGIYANNFTPDEVKALLAFYGTDAGRKAIAVLPRLAQEGAVAGQKWGQQNMPRMLETLQRRLREEGLLK